MATKKPAPKKVAKTAKQPVAKKPIAKKPVAKAPAKKAVAAKPAAAKKAVAKAPAKKAVPVKPAVKKSAPKAVAKPVAPKVAPKPVAANNKIMPKKPVPPAAKEKTVAAAKVQAPVKPAPKKVEPVKEVKIPKTTVKTSLPYKPEYKSMEQRKEVAKPNVPLVRYNDTELAEFKELILKKMDAAKRELGYLQGLITRKDDMGGDESENRYMTMEDGSISMEREQLSQMASRQITYIDHLEKAIIRIENKTYGICRVTGKLIDKARLRAVPHATLSLEAKLGFAKAPTNEQ